MNTVFSATMLVAESTCRPIRLHATTACCCSTTDIHRRQLEFRNCRQALLQRSHAMIFCDLLNSVSTTCPILVKVFSAAGYISSAGGSSKTSRQPAPWSSVPANFLSKIICRNALSKSSNSDPPKHAYALAVHHVLSQNLRCLSVRQHCNSIGRDVAPVPACSGQSQVAG